MMKYNAYLQKLRENTCIRLLIAVSKMSQTFEMTIRCMSISRFLNSLSDDHLIIFFSSRPSPGLYNLQVRAVLGCYVALLRFIIFWGITTGFWYKRGRRRRYFPPNRKSYPKKSVSIVNLTLILPALSTTNTRKGTPASILNLSFKAGSLSKMHAYRHIPAQTRFEVTLSGTSYILHV